MAYQGEYYIRRYGVESAKRKPPLRQMLKMGLPVGAGTDGTRVASYHPWTCLWWMVTSKTVGGVTLHDEADRLSREEALRLYTHGSAWFSQGRGSEGNAWPRTICRSGRSERRLLSVEEDAIRGLESVLTVVGGRIVHGSEEFAALAPELPPVSPNWSPVGRFGGYDNKVFAPPAHEHTPIMSADGRVWEAGCGCSV